MQKRIAQVIRPSLPLCYVVMMCFALLAVAINPWLGTLQCSITLLMILYTLQVRRLRRREMLDYVETVLGKMDAVTRENMVQSPIPTLMFRPESGEILWCNQSFFKVIDHDDTLYHKKLSSILPNFQIDWLLEGQQECALEQNIGEGRFRVHGSLVHKEQRGHTGLVATTYWLDVTAFSQRLEQHQETRPTVSILTLDNYEELMRNLTDTESSTILSEINQKLSLWLHGTSGIFRRYNRENYLLILEQQELDRLKEQKFEIIEDLQKTKNHAGIEATLSIGVGLSTEERDETLEKLWEFANLSIDMALSRGGNQVVLRNNSTFDYMGGRSIETEKRTKVKSRVTASALESLILGSSRVFVMGHKVPDMDAVGASVGVLALVRKCEVQGYMIYEPQEPTSAGPLYNKLLELPEYQGQLLSEEDALLRADNDSLVVVVDTNRPDQVQSIKVLNACNRVAVIDHHRRASTYIEGAALSYHELYASSACELVTELLQYKLEPAELLRIESEALLSGIVLDTKNFSLRTGARTFEAAAFLRRCGADTNEVKKLFQNNLEDTVSRYKIIQRAEKYNSEIAIATTEEAVGRVIVAQAADELLNVHGISTSFVLFTGNGELIISARSMGEVNVQLVLEDLGGGGNASAAGVQIPNVTLAEGEALLRKALDTYFKL